jgi:GT2 family glycosyltransferase
MSLVAMCAYSTEENQKDQYLKRTLQSVRETVDFTKHRMMLHVNAFTKETLNIIEEYSDILEDVIWSDVNIGTAEGINAIWRTRKQGEHAIKMDDDVVIHQSGWVDLMEEICNADKFIGQVGLKRKDCWENPNHENEFYRSTLYMQRLKWREVQLEKCHHIMGTCVMHSDNLLNELGYMWQPKLYGFDDSLMSLRSELAGFKNVFIPEIDIEHIDEGQTPFQTWKHGEADIYLKQDETGKSIYYTICQEYKTGIRDIYYNPYE